MSEDCPNCGKENDDDGIFATRAFGGCPECFGLEDSEVFWEDVEELPQSLEEE